MIDPVPLEVLLAGSMIVLAILAKHFLTRIRVPPLIGYLLLGFFLRLFGAHLSFLSDEVIGIFEFLGAIGLISLLFRVGLTSNLTGLVRQLGRAGFIWTGNILCSGLLGFIAAYSLLGLTLVPSLFAATALTATSVGVSIAAWQGQRALDSANGELLIDVAEMDDISAIILMSMLLALVPTLKEAANASFIAIMSRTAIFLFIKIFLFGGFCIFFSRYVERGLMSFFQRIKPAPDPMLLVAGTGFIIAAFAGWLGFSVAVGALFAGLVFSRDPRSVQVNASFGAVFELFMPFFFINIGLQVDPDSLTAASWMGFILLAVAVLGKILGTGLPALIVSGWPSAALISVSMVPRAEIALVVMQYGRRLGYWAVPQALFSAMVLVVAATCLLAPGALRPLLDRWPQKKDRNE